jgi:cytochrome c-type biogenesis protein CcmH/NrfF
VVRRAALALAIAWLVAAPALAADPPEPAQTPAAAPPDADPGAAPSWGYELAAELMSPFCPGRTLADCPSPAAANIRMWILVQAAAGRTKEDVEDELLARYGDRIRSAPKAEGFGWAAYLVPLGVFVGGGLLVVYVLRRMTRGAPPAPPPTARTADPELERRVDEELAR